MTAAVSSRTFLGYGCIVAAAVCWSLIGAVGRLPMSAGVSPLETAFWRTAFGCLCFMLHAVRDGGWRMPWRHALCLTGFGVWGVGAFFGLTQYAVALSGGAMTVVLLYTAPVCVALFSFLFFHENPDRRTLLAMGVALLGTALLCSSGGSLAGAPSPLGIACGLATGLCYATHYPFCRWWQQRYSTVVIYAYMFLGGTLALAVFAPIGLEHRAADWGAFLVLGIVCCYAGYYCYGQSLLRIPLVRAAAVGYLEPLLSTLWLALFWSEAFTPLGWCGSALVIGAVLTITLRRH